MWPLTSIRVGIALGLFLWTSAPSHAQQPEDFAKASSAHAPEACRVTKPDPSAAFVPPEPYSKPPSEDVFWFGSDRLWTALPASGSWVGLGHYTPDDPTFRQKLFFYRRGYRARRELEPKITITGKRLDADAPPLLSDRANNGWRGDREFMVTGINIPTLGCWQITAHYGNEELSFVISVVP